MTRIGGFMGHVYFLHIYFVTKKSKFENLYFMAHIRRFCLFMGDFAVLRLSHLYFMTTIRTAQNTTFYDKYDTNMPEIVSFSCFRLQCVYELCESVHIFYVSETCETYGCWENFAWKIFPGTI